MTDLEQQSQLLHQNKIESDKLYELLDARKKENASLASDVLLCFSKLVLTILQIKLSEARQEAARYMRDFKDIENEYLILNEKYQQLFNELEEM